MAKKDECCRVTTHDPLKDLLDLVGRAEDVEAAIYALPCSREADVACRALSAPLSQDEARTANPPAALHWCDVCRAWWHAHQTTTFLCGLARLARDLMQAREEKDGRGISLGEPPTE